MNNLKYALTIITENQIENINLLEFEKNIITLGRSMDNDIVIASPLLSENHCYFKFEEGTLKIYDNNSQNKFYINNMRYNYYDLKDSDVIRIDNPIEYTKEGLLIIVSIGKVLPQWEECLINKEFITIGRGKDNDIILDRVNLSLKQAKIINNKGIYLSNYNENNSILLNNKIIDKPTLLNNKDVFIIDNIKFIFINNKIIYQVTDYGVSLDAIDITKTVKIKGKKRDISQHVNFKALPGEFIAIVGVSGAGKSTFLKCICGVSKPTSGKVLLNGQNLFKNYETLKKLIGYVPQDNIIFNDLKLIDMLKYSANLRMPDDTKKEEKIKRINEVLEILELSEKKDVMIRNLSGGQKKRVSIAVELLADPKIFFLDEPTSGLDPGTERSMMEILRKLANMGKTIILVTHNTLNLHLCDKVTFLGLNGKLCFDGRPKDSLEFFKVDDFVDIYKLINKDTDKWHLKYENYKYKIMPTDNTNEMEYGDNKNRSFIKQYYTLLIRKFRLLFNNKHQLLLLFLQVPIIAYLITLVTTDNIFYSYEETQAILFMISTACVWLGLLNSIQEICKERNILKKEYMNDLRISAYIMSKITYLFIISIIQAFLLIYTFMLFVDTPIDGIKYSWKFESILTCFITIFSSASMGLFISVFTKNSQNASTLPTILLVPQLLFSGMLFSLKGITKFISNFIICKWSVESLGIMNDLNNLVSKIQEIIPGYERKIEECYTYSINHFQFNLIILVIITVSMYLLCSLLLKRNLESGR